jgi:hypothetical protein
VTCQEIRDLFSARLDEALAPDQQAQLDAHLAACADCAREWERFAAAVALVRGLEPARAPAGFVDRVLAARPEPWYRRLGRGLFVPWPVKLPLEAAAVVLIAGLAIVIFQRSPELQRAARPPETPPPAATPAPAESPAPSAVPERDVRAPAPVGETAPAPARQRPTDAPAAGRRSPPGVADFRSDGSERREEQRAPAAPAAERKASRLEAPAVTADVEARLQAADRDAAGREIGALVARLGGSVASLDPRSLEVVVPRAGWDELTGVLARLGSLQIDRQPATLPPAVRLHLRLD